MKTPATTANRPGAWPNLDERFDMAQRTCSVPMCDREREYSAYCRPHYRRWMETGDAQPTKPLRVLPKRTDSITERILSKTVETAEGCVEWTGRKSPGGYGLIGWQGRGWVVHRAMWTAHVGPIPTDDDWTIDHLCRNRACVNVAHLEVVTRTENSLRGGGLLVAQAKNRTRQRCPNGHRYTPDNTYNNVVGSRMCKTCKRAAWLKRKDVTATARRRQYLERRAAGATSYQALFSDWWNYPPSRTTAVPPSGERG